jgi:hypothetical protein
VEGLGKFNDLIAQHFHGVKTQENILMKGRSRTECSYIKNLFDQFIEGPAIENREIEELGAKYEEFYKANTKNLKVYVRAYIKMVWALFFFSR